MKVIMTGCNISDCGTGKEGGGIKMEGGSLEISQGRFSGNVVDICASEMSQLQVVDTTFNDGPKRSRRR